MATYQSLVGQQFGRLTVLEEFKKENGITTAAAAVPAVRKKSHRKSR